MAGHSLIPWSKIFQYYVSAEKVSYQDCANKYHTSLQAVKKHGTSEDWVKKKHDIFKAALVLMESRTADMIARRNADHIALAKSLLGGAAKQMSEKGILPTSARDVKEWIETGVKIEREALGMGEKVNPQVSITNPQGMTYKITWGDGASLEEY